jgi:hypothetical protein
MALEQEMDAVFKSSRTETDPVSGNEVPTGSLPEEVRDDIPAQLSEGEYVVPADVVRYYGVKFFEDLRSQAKSGWSDMEQNGRIGGEPMGMEMGQDELPFDIEELAVVEAAEGAYIGGYNQGGGPFAMKGFNIDIGVENRTYVGPDGTEIIVQFYNGYPITNIPEGYVRKKDAAEEVAEAVEEATPEVEPIVTQDDDDDRGPVSTPKAVDWATATVDDFQNYTNQREGMGSRAIRGMATMFGGPVAGGLVKMAQRHQDKRFLAGIDSRIESLEEGSADRLKLEKIREQFTAGSEPERESRLDTIIERSGIFGGESGMTDNLQDISGDDKTSFADTWLGDLLGLDGNLGVQGPDLQASRAGARRGEVADDDSSREAAREYGSAATGSRYVLNSDGTTRKVTTHYGKLLVVQS